MASQSYRCSDANDLSEKLACRDFICSLACDNYRLTILCEDKRRSPLFDDFMDTKIISPTEFAKPAPKEIFRPCDAGLKIAISALETQLGTIEAYNRIVESARTLKQQIDNGKAKAQNPLFRTSITGG